MDKIAVPYKKSLITSGNFIGIGNIRVEYRTKIERLRKLGMQVLLEQTVNKAAVRQKAQRKYERFYAPIVNKST
jgi:hypothetical protein